jgi:hypothetical protein
MNPEAGREYGITDVGTMIPVGQPQPAQPPAIYETQYTYRTMGMAIGPIRPLSPAIAETVRWDPALSVTVN